MSSNIEVASKYDLLLLFFVCCESEIMRERIKEGKRNRENVTNEHYGVRIRSSSRRKWKKRHKL